ncbi:MAG: tetratricopeptide repeat protein [Elusimicrobiota bacterium]
MGKQWAKQEANRNELAQYVDQLTLWVQSNPQPVLWAVAALVATALLGAGFYNRQLNRAEESWTKLAIAQSYAYSGQASAALDQVKQLADEYPATPSAAFSLLLAADVLYEQGKHKEAAEGYQKVINAPGLETTIPLAMAGLGLSREASGDYKSAAETDQRFLDTFQDHFLAPTVHASLARCLSAAGEMEKAKATYERMASLYPQTYWAEWARARLKS